MAIVSRRNTEGKRFAALNQASERLMLAQQNAQQSYVERIGSVAARQRATQISVGGQTAAAGLRAGEAATQSQRLLVEFEAGLAQKQALQRRQAAQAIGQATAGFAAAGVGSIAASQEAQRQSTLEGNIGASSANVQREQILGSAREAITGAVASGISAGASLAASAQTGPIFQRQTERQLGPTAQPDYVKETIGIDALFRTKTTRR